MVAPWSLRPQVDWTDFGAALRELELLGHLARDARARQGAHSAR